MRIAGRPAVLHRYGPERSAEEVAWEYDVLDALSRTGFPAPVPIAAFNGASTAHAAGRRWGLVSYLPGRVLGWESTPDLEEVGRFMARFHDAAAQLDMPGNGPTVPRLEELPGAVPWDRLEACLGGTDGVAAYRTIIEHVLNGMAARADGLGPPLVIHGDFTTRNVLVAGDPPRCVGLIDFAMAHRAPALADVAFGLWQAGRPKPEGIDFDPARVSPWVAGYHATRRLPADTPEALALLLQARGLQLIARWARRRGGDLRLTLERLRVIASLEHGIATSVARALSA